MPPIDFWPRCRHTLGYNLCVAAQYDCQVLVLGGGPAGARAAALLAQAGVDVLLLEAEGPDVDNLCSGLLNREGQAALGCELPGHVRRRPFEPRLEFHDRDNHLRRRYDPGYWNMDRPVFDAWLRECAAEAGSRIEYHRRARKVSRGPDGIVVQVGSDTLRPRVLIDATGWRALSRKLLLSGRAGEEGAPARDGSATAADQPERSAPVVHAFQGTVSCDLAEDAMWAVFESDVTPYYGWLVPKGEGRFLLGAGFPQGAAHTRREGDAALCSDAQPWGKLDFVLEQVDAAGGHTRLVDDKPLGCPITTITSISQLWWGRGLIFPIGEAAGLVSPSSGDGIHFSLEHANALSRSLLSSGVLDNNSAAGLSDSEQHAGILNEVHSQLHAALAELRFNCFKAQVAARPFWRGLAARAMALYLRRPVEQLPALAGS